MPFTATKFWYEKAVADVASKLGAGSKADEDLILHGAQQQVRSAYEYAQRHNRENPPALMINARTAQGTHRDALIQFFTISGINRDTAGSIVDADILCIDA